MRRVWSWVGAWTRRGCSDPCVSPLEARPGPALPKRPCPNVVLPGLLALIGVVALGASTANSALIEVDLLVLGDGLISRDTTSGLDWLDLSVSGGLTYEDVALPTSIFRHGLP